MTCGRVAAASLVVIVVGLGLASGRAAAQPDAHDVEQLVEPAPPTRASYQADRLVARSYLVPALELVGLNVACNVGARIGGAPWADVTPSTMWNNVSHAWVYDDDLFSIDQLAHPYGGAMMFSAARSTGHGFWAAAAYGFAGSLLWESFGENEPPAINDQITTSIAGAFLGEALHRWGRAVRWGGGAKPSLGRQILAGVIDPAGAANLATFGAAWRPTAPPNLHAFMGAGIAVPLAGAESGPAHLELAVSHGLPSDPLFVPRVPFDHFDLRFQLDAGRHAPTGYLDVRGLVVGTTRGEGRRRTLWGLYGTYDYWDGDGVRAGAIGVGPGLATHVALGDRGFLEVSGVLAVVPWGAAGGSGDVEGVRDYHHGIGGAEIAELKLGRQGVGVVRLSARAIEIFGELRGDDSEAVVVTSAGLMAALSRHQAVGVEVVYSARHASFTDAATTAFDQAAQLRIMYAITSGRDFGGPVAR